MSSGPLTNYFDYRSKSVSDKFLTASIAALEKEYPNVTYPFLDKEKDLVGIEVEVENITGDILNNLTKTPAMLWTAKEDGSLRNNGIEFVTVPIFGSSVPLVVTQLKKAFEKVNPKYSFSSRTSVHIHINARTMSVEEIISTLFVYITVERLLYRWVKRTVGVERADNIFCLPINQTEYTKLIGNKISNIIEYLEYEGDIRSFKEYGELAHEWKKYLGINLKRSIDSGCGTIEFRHLSGTIDVKQISTWVGFLLKIKKYAKSNSLDSIIKGIANLNSNSEYENFLRSVFEELSLELSCTNIKKHVENNVSFIKECIEYRNSSNYITKLKKTPYMLFKSSLMKETLEKLGVILVTEGKPTVAEKKKKPVHVFDEIVRF